jgi:hypothetical protein
MLGHDDPYWHTDLDTIDNVDSTRLKHVGVLTSTLAALPSWGRFEARTMTEWLMSYSQRELTRAWGLARADGSTRRELAEMSLRIETERAASLAGFLGADAWDATKHVKALRATHMALGRSLDRAEGDVRPTQGEEMPSRILDGPICSDATQYLAKEDRDFLEKLSPHHGAAPQVLANLADGTRTASDIAACLTLDFEQSFSTEDVSRALSLLGEMGYVTMES